MKDLRQGPVARTIVSLSMPLLLGNLFQQLYNVVDSAIVGNFVGADALAATGQSFPVMFLLVALIMGFTLGSSVVVAQHFGAGDEKAVRRMIETSYAFVAVCGVALTVLGLLLADPLLRLLGTPERVFAQASTYLRVVFLGIAPSLGYNMVAAILRGLGDTRTPTVAIVIATVLNAVLALVLVAGFGLGVAGAAIGTVVSQAASFLIVALWLGRKNKLLKLAGSRPSFDRALFAKSARIGLPAGLSQTFVGLSMMFLVSLANGFGPAVAAAYAVAGRLDTFASLPAMSIGLALGSFAGQNLAAGLEHRAKRALGASILLGAGIAAACSIAMVVFRVPLIGIFSRDPAVLDAGSLYLLIVSPFYAVFAAMFVVNGLLRGSGASFVPMFSTFVALIGARAPVAWILSTTMGPEGIWVAMPVGWAMGLVLAVVYYATGKWKGHVVARAPSGRGGSSG